MQNTNRKFWCFLWLLCGLLFFVSGAPVNAQSAEAEAVNPSGELNRVLPIRTHVIRPILLSFFKSENPNQIQGEVFFPEIRAADRLRLRAFDSSGSRIYSQEFDVDVEKVKSQKFTLEVPKFGLPAGSYMEAELYDQERQVGRDAKTLPQVETIIRYRISNLKVSRGKKIASVSVDFENGSLQPIEIRPQVKIWQQSVVPEKIVKRDFLEQKKIEAKSRATLNYDFPLPDRPGVYRIEIIALDDKKQVLSGQLEDFLVIDGDFATFDGSFVTPSPGNDPTIELKFVGDYEGDAENLFLELGVNLFDKRGKLVDRLTTVQRTPVLRDGFKQTFILDGSTEELGKIDAKVVLKNEAGEWLSELAHIEDFTGGRGFVSEKEATWLQADVAEELLPGWLWFHWLGLVLALLCVLFLIFLARNMRKKSVIMGILFAFVGFSGTVQASLEVFWHHPVPGWYYNSDAVAPFEEFGTMKIQGNIFNTLTQKGFFYVVPDRIVVSFFKDLEYDEDGVRICTDCFYLEADLSSAVVDATCVNEDNYVGPAAEICDNKTYRFELDLPTAIDEGRWGVQVLFKLDGVWYGTNWADGSPGGDWYRVNFDSTPPALIGDLTYNGTPPPLNGDLVYEAKQPIVDGPTGLTQLHQNFATQHSQKSFHGQNRAQLIAIADEKLKKRNHLILAEIRGREQAYLSGALTTTQEQVLYDEIAGAGQNSGLVGEVNALTFTPNLDFQSITPNDYENLAINDIGKLLGQFPPNHLVVQAYYHQGVQGVLSPEFTWGIIPVKLTPSAGDTFANNIDGQLSGINTQIAGLASQIDTKKALLESVKQVHEKEAIEVGMTCADPEIETGVAGVGCNENILVANVRGNFCEYGEVCEAVSIRKYEVCDQVGNCAYSDDIAARVDWYDPVAPDANDIDIIKFKDDVGGTETVITGDGADNTFAAGDQIAIEIDGSDPQADYTTHPAEFDNTACGNNAGAFHYEQGPGPGPDTGSDPGDFYNYCSQTQVRCPLSSSKRGVQTRAPGSDGACNGDCPNGYALQGDLCVPFCDFRLFDGCFPFLLIGDQCEVTEWLPDPATVPFGDSFVQVNNCGQSRSAVGTKSITGTLNHFLDGKEVFGAYIYDTTEDTLPITYALNTSLDGGGTDGYSAYTSIEDFADMTIESVNSPSAGNAFKVSTFDVAGAGRYGAWQRSGVTVTPNTDYVLSYWVKTDATVNKDQEGAWVAITGNGSTTDIWTQYESTMEGVAGNLNWYKVIVPFTTPSGTTSVDIELRVQQQNNKVAYFDDVKIFVENWRFDDSKTWYSETLDDADGTCDYIQTSGGVTVDGPDDRCGAERFPEKAVLVYTSDGFYIFDAEKGTFWMKAVKDPGSSTFGRFVFNALMAGQTFGLNGNLYLGHRFNEPNSAYDDRNGAVEVMNLLNDEMYTHRMSGCYLLAGAKGVGSSYSSNNNCEDNGYYSWSGFVNDKISQRNVTRSPWSNVLPDGRQITTHQINHADANVISSKTYVSVATDYGISVLNKTDNTVQDLEWDGYHGDDYTWDYLPSSGSSYHKSYIEDDGSLWYKWDYQRNSDDGSRIWKLNDVTSLAFNNGLTTSSDVADSRIQPTGSSGAYPTTGQDEDSTAFDVQGDIFLSGGVVGLEKFAGTMVGGDASAHPNLSKSIANKNYATAPLYGKVLGHWVDAVDDTSDYNNDLTNQGSVTTTAVASGTDLVQFGLNGTNQYLSSGSSDFNVNGPVTFGTWVKTTGSEDGGYIMSKGDSDSIDFAIYRNADNTISVTGTAETAISGYTLGETSNDWDFVAVTFDGTNKKTYLNGQLISNVADTKVVFDGSGSSGTLRGRYVRIEKNTGEHLSLAEVKVFNAANSTNLALSGTATQIHTGYSGVASRAIDGNTDGVYNNNSVTHTNSSSGNLWWEVDLGAEYDLGNIVVSNRTDCCTSRLSGAVVEVLDASRDIVTASSPLSSATSQTLTLTPSPLPSTRYVRVEKVNSGTYPHLYLAEVQVFDSVNANIATSGTASAISEHSSVPKEVAIDGNTNGDLYDDYSVFRSNTSSTPTTLWWEVDLGSEKSINEVTVWNRTDSRWDYLTGSIVKLLDGSRTTVATSSALSSDTTQNPVFGGGTSSSLFIGTKPSDSGLSANLLSGAVALPFISSGAYTGTEIQNIYDTTVRWFSANALLTIQGVSNNVEDVVFGDDDDYFVVTSYGITHFDSDGVVIRTLTTAANSSLNTQIISTDINDIDYKNRYLIIAYEDPDGNGAQQARGLEIITIGTQPND